MTSIIGGHRELPVARTRTRMGNMRAARSSFVDVDNLPEKHGGTAPPYRNVLFVEPYRDARGIPNFRAIHGFHAGGCVWYGNLLYVAGTDRIRVFDLNHPWKVDPTTPVI